ncbi:MAG: hypothetical protein AB7F86_14730 [Bdellovibrionales bacterium]
MKKLLLIGALGFAMGGCAVIPLTGDHMSMAAVTIKGKTVPKMGGGQKVGMADEKFCAKDEPDSFKRTGYVDRLVEQALKKQPSADYIANAAFKYLDADCVRMTGTLMSLNSNIESVKPPAQPEASTGPFGRSLASESDSLGYIEIVDVSEKKVELSARNGAKIMPGSSYMVFDKSGQPRGSITVQNGGDDKSTWATITNGKAFWGWTVKPAGSTAGN